MSQNNENPVPLLLMVRELGSGGIERDVTKLAMGLHRSRFTPYVATYQANGLRYDELKTAQVPVIPLEVSSFKSMKIISTAFQLGQFIRQKRIRVLHAFDSTAVLGVPLARLLGVPVVLASTLGNRALLDARTRRQFQFIDHLVDAVVVNCESMRKHLIREFAVPAGRIELCYNGVDTKEFCPLPTQTRKPSPLAEASVVIGTICVLRREKGLETLQEAFAATLRSFPSARLLIVGSGPELEKLKNNCLRLGIEDACIFMPAVASVAPLLRAIDIFVSSSYSEALSNSILEAMACGCCVIGSRVGGTPELIADNERGLLFTVGDTEELARKLAVLIQDVTLRRRLGRMAADFAASTLNIGIAVGRTMEIYETLLHRKSAWHPQQAPAKQDWTNA
jgi:glycosyltransferase involved in cell wall biosynthesis